MDLPAALTLAASLWLSLPHGDTVWDLLETTVPFTVPDHMNTGGLLTGRVPVVGSGASSWTQTTWRLGGHDVTDLSHGGMPLVYPDTSFFEQITVTPAGSSAERTSAGLQISLVPRRAGRTWSSAVGGAIEPASLQAAAPGPAVPIAQLRSWRRIEGTVGGPVSGGAELFAAGTLTRSSHVERGESAVLPGDATSLFAHLTAGHASGGQADVLSWVQGTRSAFSGRARFADRNIPERDRLAGIQGRWTAPGRLPLQIAAGMQSTQRTPDVNGAAPNGVVERLQDGPVPWLALASGGTHRRWSVGAEVSPGARKHHALTAGGSVSLMRATASPLGTGFIGETVNGVAARAWQYGYAGDARWREASTALYASDTITIGPRLTIDAGGRLEMIRGSSGAATGIKWTNAAPHLTVRFLPIPDGPWVILASTGRSHLQLPLNALAYGDPASPQGLVFRWTDLNGDRLVGPAEVGPLIARVGPGAADGLSSSIDPALRRPSADELLLAVERRLGRAWVARLTGVTRRERNLLGVVNTGAPASAYLASSVFDPGLDLLGPEDDQQLPVYSRLPSTFGSDRFLLTNPGGASSTYQGIDVTVQTTAGGRWNLLFGATATRSNGPAASQGFRPEENDQGVLADADPNAATNARGRLFFDRGYVAKLSASYRAPWDVTLGTVARYQDGQPFARLVFVPDLPQGPDVIRAYANGRSRFTYTLTLDGRAEKSVRLQGARVAVALEAFNLLNTSHEVEEDVVTGPSYRTPTAVQPPRVVRLALRMEF